MLTNYKVIYSAINDLKFIFMDQMSFLKIAIEILWDLPLQKLKQRYKKVSKIGRSSQLGPRLVRKKSMFNIHVSWWWFSNKASHWLAVVPPANQKPTLIFLVTNMDLNMEMAPSHCLNQCLVLTNHQGGLMEFMWGPFHRKCSKVSNLDRSMKITNLRLQLQLPGANELIFIHLSDLSALTHWGRDKVDAISQTTFSSAFS